MSIHAIMAASANELLRAHGQQVTLTRTNAAVYDPTTGATDGAASVETGMGYVVNYGDSRAADQPTGGGLTSSGRVKLILGTSGISAAPGIGDRVTLRDASGADVIWSVLDCETIGYATTAVYICQLGR